MLAIRYIFELILYKISVARRQFAQPQRVSLNLIHYEQLKMLWLLKPNIT